MNQYLIYTLAIVFILDTAIYGVLAPFHRSPEGRALFGTLLAMSFVTGLAALIRFIGPGPDWSLIAHIAYVVLIAAGIWLGVSMYRSQIDGYRRHKARIKANKHPNP